jgi:hypothetical protein
MELADKYRRPVASHPKPQYSNQFQVSLVPETRKEILGAFFSFPAGRLILPSQ